MSKMTNTKATREKYDNYSRCIKCNGKNKCIIKNSIENIVSEVETKCPACGHKDYWVYGLYESKYDR